MLRRARSYIANNWFIAAAHVLYPRRRYPRSSWWPLRGGTPGYGNPDEGALFTRYDVADGRLMLYEHSDFVVETLSWAKYEIVVLLPVFNARMDDKILAEDELELLCQLTRLLDPEGKRWWEFWR